MFDVMIRNTKLALIADRARTVDQWLEDEAPYVQFDQRHLDAGTPEQAYWHLGYAAALRDIVRLINAGDGDTSGTSSRYPSAGRDE